MKIPLIDLKKQYKSIKSEIDKALKRIVDNQDFIMGEDVRFLEDEIASYCNSHFAVAVSSGTEALILILKALGIRDGDEVITTPFTFVATAGSISNVGATPVFCDIDPRTYNIDPDKISEKITKNTRAIIPVHLYGQCADMDSIIKIGKKHKLYVIEDAAQSIGAKYKGKEAGSMGDAGSISFFPSKNLGAFGDGGMVITNSENIANTIRLLRLHGSGERYKHSIIGTNARLDNLQAAILRVKLRYLDMWTEKRRQNAEKYNELFKHTDAIVPYVPEYNIHVYHQYVIKVPADKRDSLLKTLSGLGIAARVYYPIPLHLQRCYKYLNYKEGDMANSEDAARTTLALPVYPELEDKQLEFIATSVKKHLAS